MHFWDWKSGYNFQTGQTKPQPGSLENEAGIFAACFDRSGSRLITGKKNEDDFLFLLGKNNEFHILHF